MYTIYFYSLYIFYLGVCPSDWHWINADALGCFHFAVEANPASWFEGLAYCQELEEGAWLAEVPDEVTQAFLVGYAETLEHQYWWLGATDFYHV